MFPEMRRSKQALSPQETSEILQNASSGVLALDGDYPYAVPISYVYDGERLYFHCAKTGHKLDAIRRNSKACFCVIARDEVIPEKYTTRYQSAIVFGRIRVIEDEQAAREAIDKLIQKYAPNEPACARQQEVDQYRSALCMLEMTIEHMSGKEGLELTKLRNK